MQLASCTRCSAAILATRRLSGHAALRCWIGAACLVASGDRPLVTFRYHSCTACYTFLFPLCFNHVSHDTPDYVNLWLIHHGVCRGSAICSLTALLIAVPSAGGT